MPWDADDQTRWLAIRRALARGPIDWRGALRAWEEAEDEAWTDAELARIVEQLTDRRENWTEESALWKPDASRFESPLLVAPPDGPLEAASGPSLCRSEWNLCDTDLVPPGDNPLSVSAVAPRLQWSVVIKTPGVDDVQPLETQHHFFGPLFAQAASLLFGAEDPESLALT